MAPSGNDPAETVMLIVVRRNLWRSTDGGGTWKRIVRGIDNRFEYSAIAVGARKGKPVWFLGTEGDGIYRSDDDGLSWRPFSEGLIQKKASVLSANHDSVLLATTDGRLYGINRADTGWELLFEHPGKIRALSTGAAGEPSYFGTAAGEVFRSDDAGRTWTGRHSYPDPAGVTAFARGSAPAEPPLAVGGGTSGVFLPSSPEDPAATLHQTNNGLADQRITSLLITGGPLFAVTWRDGVFRSTDGGRNWEQRATGLTRDQQGDRRGLPQFTTLRRGPDGALYLAGYDGLFSSRDEGGHWGQIVTLPQTLLIDFAISPDYENDGELVAFTYWKGLFRSRDRGESWTPINRGLAPSYVKQMERKLKASDEYSQIQRFHSVAYPPDYANSRSIYAGLRNWLLISNDGGDSWDQIELTRFGDGKDVIPDRFVFSDGFAEDGTLFFCSRFDEGKPRHCAVFRSTDRGRTFSLVQESGGKYHQSMAISPAFSRDGTVFVCSARGESNSDLFRSTDGGDTWEEVTGALQFVDLGGELAISPAFPEDRALWVGTEVGLWRSRDAGDTWEHLDTGAFPVDAYVEMVTVSPDYARDRTLLVTAKGDGLFRSRDGGDTFQAYLPEFSEANDQFYRPWSYSPGQLIKYAPGYRAEGDDLFAMTCEKFARIGESAARLPVRETAATVGGVDLRPPAIGAAILIAFLVVGGWGLAKRLRKK